MKLLIDKKEYNIKYANNFYLKLKGLMFKKNINYGLLIPKCNSAHTFFMKDNIDILAINHKNVVLYKYQNIAKNKIITFDNNIDDTFVLKMPKNSTKKVKIGDILTFKDKDII